MAMFNILIGSSEASAPHSVTPTTEEKAGTPAIRRMRFSGQLSLEAADCMESPSEMLPCM